RRRGRRRPRRDARPRGRPEPRDRGAGRLRLARVPRGRAGPRLGPPRGGRHHGAGAAVGRDAGAGGARGGRRRPRRRARRGGRAQLARHARRAPPRPRPAGPDVRPPGVRRRRGLRRPRGALRDAAPHGVAPGHGVHARRVRAAGAPRRTQEDAMSRRTLTVPPVARRTAAAVGGLLCAMAVAALAVTDGTVGPAPLVHAPADARTVPVAAAETALGCPVPAKLDQPDVGDDEFSAAPVAPRSRLAVAALGADGTPELAMPGGGAAEELVGPLETGREAAVAAGDLPGPRLLRVTPGGATYAAGTVTSVT